MSRKLWRAVALAWLANAVACYAAGYCGCLTRTDAREWWVCAAAAGWVLGTLNVLAAWAMAVYAEVGDERFPSPSRRRRRQP